MEKVFSFKVMFCTIFYIGRKNFLFAKSVWTKGRLVGDSDLILGPAWRAQQHLYLAEKSFAAFDNSKNNT